MLREVRLEAPDEVGDDSSADYSGNCHSPLETAWPELPVDRATEATE
jgi:hypothetical protein